MKIPHLRLGLLGAFLATSVLFTISASAIGTPKAVLDGILADGEREQLDNQPSKKGPSGTDEAVVTGDEPASDPSEDPEAMPELNLDAEEVVDGPSEDVQVPVDTIEVGSGGAEPTDFERRMFRIFKQSAPVSSQKWEELVGSRRQEVYGVQAGDTLWDISQTLFGEGFFWSKLWAENGGLENPHQISPGQRIQLMAGTESNAPAITVGQGGGDASIPEGQPPVSVEGAQTMAQGEIDRPGDLLAAANATEKLPPLRKGRGPMYREEALQTLTPEELASGTNIEVDELVPRPEIPKRKPGRAVLKKLPPSFVARVQPKEGEYDQTGLDAKPPKSMTVPATIVPNSIIVDRVPEALGKIEEIEAQEKVAALGQTVFVRLEEKAAIGQRFSVLYPKEKIRVSAISSYGPIVEVGGRVEIIGVVNEDKNVYRASVIFTVNPIRLGSILVNEPLPKSTYSRRGTRTTIEAEIIGGEYDQQRRMIGEGSVIYLDQGHKAGLNNGDILPVQSRRGVRRESTKFPDWNRAIGLVKLVRVDEGVSTAIVLEAHEEILVGDRTGGKLSPPAHYREEKVEDKTDF